MIKLQNCVFECVCNMIEQELREYLDLSTESRCLVMWSIFICSPNWEVPLQSEEQRWRIRDAHACKLCFILFYLSQLT